VEGKTKKQESQERALLSGDPNRILWAFNKSASYALFQHSLNVTTASAMLNSELLQLKGVGPAVISSIKKAVNTTKKGVYPRFSV
jgi:hypothetical protein